MQRIICRAHFLPNSVGKMRVGDVYKCYTGAKATKYFNAAKFVSEHAANLTAVHARIQLFIKAENTNPCAKMNPPPRAIQFRDIRFGVVLAAYLKPLEHAFYRMRGGRGRYARQVPWSRPIGKGHSSTGRARMLREKLAGVKDACVISLDAKQFDKHVSLALLQIEHAFYRWVNHDPDFAHLLQLQLTNRGSSREGVSYKVVGKRMSGDMNTALGNCLLMVLMVTTAMEGHVYDILDDGDDCLVILPRADLAWALNHLPAAFLTYGFELKVEGFWGTEGPGWSMAQVEWCQSNPIEITTNEWRFVRNPIKVLSTALQGSKYFTSIGARAKLINTIGLAELMLNNGVPVLQEYGLALMRNSGTKAILKIQETDDLWYRITRELGERNMKQLARVDPSPPTWEARESFEIAFGISPTDQLVWEELLRNWSFTFNTTTEVGPAPRDCKWHHNHQCATDQASPRTNPETRDRYPKTTLLPV